MDNLVMKVGTLGATIVAMTAVVGLTCLVALILWQHLLKPKQARGQSITALSTSPGAAPAQIAASLDAVTEDELANAMERLAVLPQFLKALDGVLVDCHGGAFVTQGICGDCALLQLLVTSCRGNSMGIVTRTALERYVTYQEGLGRVLMKSERQSTGELE